MESVSNLLKQVWEDIKGFLTEKPLSAATLIVGGGLAIKIVSSILVVIF